MTLSKHGDKQICSIPWVSFLSESLTLNGLPKHLDIMVYKAIGLRVDVFQYHLSLHGKLEQMDKVIYRIIGIIYWLYLFIGFIYSIWWLYLLDLSIGLIYWLYLFIGFIYSIWWLYLLGLSIGFSFSVHSIHPHSNLIQIFSQLRKEHLYISLTIHISRSHGKNLPLSITPHSGLIKLTLLQLHHRTSLIKLTNITSLHHIYYTCSLIKLTNITSLHHNYYTCSILTLHYFNIVSHYSVSTHLQIPSDIQFLHLPSIFISLAQRCPSYSISNYIWNSLKLLLPSGNVKINPGLRPIDQNPVFCTICSKKIN